MILHPEATNLAEIIPGAEDRVVSFFFSKDRNRLAIMEMCDQYFECDLDAADVQLLIDWLTKQRARMMDDEAPDS